MRLSLVLSGLSAAILMGCGGGGTEVITPPPPPGAEFILTLVPDPEESATSTALGWQSAIPGIAGTILPADSSVPAKSFTASAQGKAALTGLVSGTYIIEAARWLTQAEVGRLGTGDDAVGYAGRWTVQVAGGTGAATLDTPASRKKGLVISEWAFNPYGYDFGGFIELFNNADTTVYLDGIILGEGFSASYDAPIFPCPLSAPFRNDPQGIWSRYFQQFPGSGRDYPLLPGATAVIATDAIDHRPFEPRALDLSHADFEFAGVADVDNPDVPNMIDVGVRSYLNGHGSFFAGLVQVPFLARPLDVGLLPRALTPDVSAVFARFPADAILDAFALGTTYPPEAGGRADCPPLVHPRFDRKESRARGLDDLIEYEHSVSRRHAPTQAGRVLLQWTRSGNADLMRTSRSPGDPSEVPARSHHWP